MRRRQAVPLAKKSSSSTGRGDFCYERAHCYGARSIKAKDARPKVVIRKMRARWPVPKERAEPDQGAAECGLC
jgi:hypothetical protein